MKRAIPTRQAETRAEIASTSQNSGAVRGDGVGLAAAGSLGTRISAWRRRALMEKSPDADVLREMIGFGSQ